MMSSSLSIQIRRTLYLSLGLIDRVLSRAPRVTVLCYHSIASDNWRFAISKEMFEQQIKALSVSYTFIPLAEVLTYNGRTPAIAIAFDDGYQDVLDIVPVLDQYNIRPTLFVLGDPTRANHQELGTKRDFLSVEELKALHAKGYEIGSHSLSHEDFHSLTPNQIIEQIQASKRMLERTLGFEISSFAYPRGRYTKAVVSAVKDAGYTRAFSMDDGFIDRQSDAYTIPRIGVDHTHTVSELLAMILPLSIVVRGFLKRSPLKKAFL